MGNRIKGKVKKKSIKASLGSDASSKRKLSRMGKKQKRDHSGLQASFIGRSACLKQLQISLKDFRRLCILKGIYPREPLNNKVPGKKKGQTFYHVKDIKAIAHEPILEKFREFSAFMKKVRRAAGRNELSEAARKNAIMPQYTLHHLVRERYPRFQDALSDLDDCLTTTYLLAALPAKNGVSATVINKAKALAAAWGAYCCLSSSITKSFVSVKGVYLEADIQNTATVRWVIPHAFTQFMPEDVDYRVIQTFFEFYETLLNFVLFKLYNEAGVRYPFTAAIAQQQDIGSSSGGGNTSTLLGVHLRALTTALDANNSSGQISTVVSEAVAISDKGDENIDGETNMSNGDSNKKKKKSKELIKSVGAALNKLTAEDDCDDQDDDSVDVSGPLHAALDSIAEEEMKANASNSVFGGRFANSNPEALQRRGLFQGLTFFLAREVPRGYLELVCLAYGGAVGWEGENSPISAKDPSISHHICDRPTVPSSFSKLPKSREFVQPQWILDCANFMYLLPVSKYMTGSTATLPPHLSPWVDHDEEGYKPRYAEEIERLKNGEDVEMEEEENLTDKKDEKDDPAGSKKEEEEDEEMDEKDDDESESDREDQQAKKRKKENADAHEMAKTMMSRKAAHLYGRMQHGISQRKAKVDALHERRKEIESKKKKEAKSKH